MVITCPHALGLAIPLVVAVSTSISTGKGILIRDRRAFENARSVNAVVFDKTGTLTKGAFSVTDVVPPAQEYGENDVLKLASSLGKYFEHVKARGDSKGSGEKRHTIT